jgi:hypothetical protein
VTATPATCTPNVAPAVVFVSASGTSGALYYCSAVNTWSAIGSSSVNISTSCMISGGPITGTGALSGSVALDSETGSGAYAIPNSDCGKFVYRNNSAAVSDTLAQAGSGGSFPAGWFAWYQCVGAGGCTITPTASTINGGASLTMPAGTGLMIQSDGSNYRTAGTVAGSNAILTTYSYSGTPTFTVSASSTQAFKMTLAGNVSGSTMATTAATAGQQITFILVEPSGGGDTFVWPSNVLNPCTISPGANVTTTLTGTFDGTNLINPACTTNDPWHGQTLPPVAFSNYPACSATYDGTYGAINDSTSGVPGTTVTGGGSIHVGIYCNGTAWTVVTSALTYSNTEHSTNGCPEFPDTHYSNTNVSAFPVDPNNIYYNATLTPTNPTVSAASWTGGTVTMTVSSTSGITSGNQYQIVGVNPTAYNNSQTNGAYYTITVIDGTHLSYPLSSNPGSYVSGGTVWVSFYRFGSTPAMYLNTATNSTATPTWQLYNSPTNAAESDAGPLPFTSSMITEGYLYGTPSDCTLANNTDSNCGSDAHFVVLNTSTCTLWETFGTTMGRWFSAATWAGGTVTVTISSTQTLTGITTGNSYTVTGVTPSGYNGAFTVTVTGPTTFTYPLASNPGAYSSGGTIVSSQLQAVSTAKWNLYSNNLRPNTTGWAMVGADLTGQSSADAGGLPIWPLTLTHAELFSGNPITHAIRFTLPQSVSAGYVWVWPATHGGTSGSGTLPLGARMILPAGYSGTCQHFDNIGLNFSTYSPAQRIITAMQNYGVIFADFGASAALITADADQGWGSVSNPSSDTYILNGWLHCIQASDFTVIKEQPTQGVLSGAAQ